MFRLEAEELCELLTQEKAINSTFEKIFSDNIRGFLGNTNIINKKITNTLRSEQRVYFPILNNGITILCEQFKLPKTPQLGNYSIPTVNPVIVNGLQTTYLIYQEYLRDPELIKDVSVTIRLYETKDPHLVHQITDATNTQSAITFRDKLSNQSFIQLTKEIFNNKDIAIISKRGEVFSNRLSQSLSKSIHIDKLLLLWYAAFMERPDIAQFPPKLVYKDIYQACSSSGGLLTDLFDGSPSSKLYGQLLLVFHMEELFKIEYMRINSISIDDNILENYDSLQRVGEFYRVYIFYKILEDNKEGKMSFNITDIIEAIDFASTLIKYQRGNDCDKSTYMSSIIKSPSIEVVNKETIASNRDKDYFLGVFNEFQEPHNLVRKLIDAPWDYNYND